MISSLSIFILVILFITWISGTVLHSSILSTFLRNSRHSLNLEDYDKIVVAIASVKVLLQGLVTYGGILYYTGLFTLLSTDTYLPFFVTFMSSVDMCFWNTCWLSVFYCLKLVNVSHGVFRRLKSSFSSALTLLLLGSAVGNCIINLPFLWMVVVNVPQNVTGKNSSVTTYSFKMHFIFAICNVMLTTCLPFLLTFICIVFSVTSLLRHVRRIRKHQPKVKYSQIRAHVQASRTMVLRLFLDLIFSFNIVSVILFSLNVGEVLGTLSWVIIMIYPSVQSIVLITGNPKLKKGLLAGHKCCYDLQANQVSLSP